MTFPRVAALLTLLFAVQVCVADGMNHDTAVETARDALRGDINYPWYDEAKDGLRRIDVKPPRDVAARKSRWEAQPINWTWPPWVSTFFEALGWLLLVLAIVALIYFLVRAFGFVDWWNVPAGIETADDLQGDIDRVEALPFNLLRPQADLLSEARRHYETGDFNLAMIYLYSYQLVQLDKHQMIRLTKGKTNRQYLREIRRRVPLFELVRGSMFSFEDVFFGHHVLRREQFESCWNRLDEFHQQLEPVAA